MTVGELIDQLQMMPHDAVVKIDIANHTDYENRGYVDPDIQMSTSGSHHSLPPPGTVLL